VGSDVEAFARYSTANNVPFLARNFGTFAYSPRIDVFDSGRKKASLREREAQLSQAKENLAELRMEVELQSKLHTTSLTTPHSRC